MEVALPAEGGAADAGRRGSGDGSTPSRKSGIFPIECFKCCPPTVKGIVPGTWQRIQDFTHLSLVFGVVGSAILVVNTIFKVVNRKCFGTFCVKEALALVFILPCTMYFVRIIGQYDERLQKKQAQAKEQKEQLTRAYNELLSDMDTLLTKSAESSAGLAERSFESKRRDFLRFLERAKSRYTQVTLDQALTKQLLSSFRRFVLNWLHVFEECSIDPINCPKRVVTTEELNRCENIGEVCDLLLDRLRVTEVRFISIQRDQDAQMLRKNRNEFRRLTTAPDAKNLLQLQDYEAGRDRALTTELAPGAGGGSRMTWLSCKRGQCGCHCSSGQTVDGFPREARCCCGRLVLLSREHAVLLMGFLVGPLIILLEFVNMGRDEEEKRDLITVLCAVFNQVCLIVLLCRFEEIDIIQQLEREVRELQKAERSVQQQREKMNEFWNNAQKLTELWLHRTVPRLDLYKEVHSQLEDAPDEKLNEWTDTANQRLEAIERGLGELDHWRNNGAFSVETKKNFGKQINQLCQEQDFSQMSKKLDEIARTGMKALQASSPSPPPPTGALQMVGMSQPTSVFNAQAEGKMFATTEKPFGAP